MADLERSRKLSRLLGVHTMKAVTAVDKTVPGADVAVTRADKSGPGADTTGVDVAISGAAAAATARPLVPPKSPEHGKKSPKLHVRPVEEEDGEDGEAIAMGMSVLGFAARRKSSGDAARLEQTLGLERLGELQAATRRRLEVRLLGADAAAGEAGAENSLAGLRVAARRGEGSERLWVSRGGRSRGLRLEWKREGFAAELAAGRPELSLELLPARGDQVLARARVSTAAWPPDRRHAAEVAVQMVPEGTMGVSVTLSLGIVSTPKIGFRARGVAYSVREVKLALLRVPVATGEDSGLLAKRDSLFFRGDRLDLLIGGGMGRRRETLHASAGVLSQLQKRASLYDAAAGGQRAEGTPPTSPKPAPAPAPAAESAPAAELAPAQSPRSPALDWGTSGVARRAARATATATGYAAEVPQAFPAGLYRQASLGGGGGDAMPLAYAAVDVAPDGSGGSSAEPSSDSALPSPRAAAASAAASASASAFPSLNERYQRALEALDGEGEGGSFERRLERLSELVEAAKSFFATALDYARVIISEAFLPEHLRTVKPTKSGGQLGGRKYLVRGILFKFALDDAAVFGRNANARAACSKVAGHELKGLRVYQATRTRGLCFPLCCLVSYMGLQLVALSELPLGPDTLGNNDAGREVRTGDTEVAELIRAASAQLLVAPHRCGPGAAQTIFSAVDLEGHRGRDGRIYLLDFSRSLPPAEAGPGGEHLYRLFRPEFLHVYGTPLSADAFSRFQTDEEEAQRLNAEAVRAARHLTETHIPTVVVPQLMAAARDYAGGDLTSLRLTPFLQRSGVNTRYLGLVLRELRRLHEAERVGGAAVQADPRARELREKLMDMTVFECCARAIKIFLRSRLRDIAETPGALDEAFYREICFVLNSLLCTDVVSQSYFAETLMPLLRQSFSWEEDGTQVLDRLFGEPFAVRWNGSCASFLILQRVRKMMGLKIAKATMEVLRTNKSLFHEMGFLDRFDIVLVKPVMKMSSIVEVSKGALFSLKAQLQVADVSKLRYLQMSAKHWLKSQPSTAVYCSEYADVLLRQAQVLARVAAAGGAVPDLAARLEALSRRIESYLGRALALEPRNAALLFRMARALEFFGLHEAAELRYLQSLLLEVSGPVLETFALFLRERNDPLADAYRQRCDKLNEGKLSRMRKSMGRN